MTKVKLAVALVAVILMTIVVIQNTGSVETKILFFTVTLSAALLFALVFAAGVMVGLLIAFSLAGKKNRGS